MHLQRPDGRDHNHAVGLKAAYAALYVEELLRPAVCAEARLGNDVLRKLQSDFVGEDRAVAVGYIGKGAGVHKTGCILQGLKQIGADCIFK